MDMENMRENMRRGVIPGVMAGYVFLAYAGPGMQDAIGGMIGSNAFIGFILHVIISIIAGALYTGVFMQYAKGPNPLVDIVAGGLIYGVIWWVVGANVIMPVITNAIANPETPAAVLSLDVNDASFFGHIIFGHLLAFLVVLRDQALNIGK